MGNCQNRKDGDHCKDRKTIFIKQGSGTPLRSVSLVGASPEQRRLKGSGEYLYVNPPDNKVPTYDELLHNVGNTLFLTELIRGMALSPVQCSRSPLPLITHSK